MQLPLDASALASPTATLLALLVAGHLLGDFALQSRATARNKHRPAVALRHAVLVGAAHLTVLLPHLGTAVVAASGAIALLHGAVDFGGARRSHSRARKGLGLFLADQGIHLLVLAGAWIVLIRPGSLPAHVPQEWIAAWAAAAVVAGAFALDWTGGSTIVERILGRLDPELQDGGGDGSGRLIGGLERTITLVLILLGEWAAMVLLLAAKSIARFEELKKRRFAEYYLVGTLASLLVAILIGLALRAFLFL